MATNHESTMPLKPGSKLGSHEVLSPIGAGAMGEVNYPWTDDDIVRSASSLDLPLSPLAGRGMG